MRGLPLIKTCDGEVQVNKEDLIENTGETEKVTKLSYEELEEILEDKQKQVNMLN